MKKLKDFKTFEKHNNLNYYFKDVAFIIDDGEGSYLNSQTTKLDTGEVTYNRDYMPRYSVWAYDSGRGKFDIVDMGDNLKELQDKYDIPDHKIRKDL